MKSGRVNTKITVKTLVLGAGVLLIAVSTAATVQALNLATPVVRVNTDSSGAQTSSGNSDLPHMSSDGRYVAFRSFSTNLVSGDTNSVSDIFVKDTQTGTTTRVSTDSSGNQSNGASYTPRISGDGRYVAFVSTATNLVAGDTNGQQDVFVKDLQTGTTVRASTNSSGGQGSASGGSDRPSISDDGRYVVFHSGVTTFVAGDTNSQTDIFRKDLQTGTTIRVSTDSSGNQVSGGVGGSTQPSISGDGRYVAFQSSATNLVAGDTNAVNDIFVKDLQTGTTIRVSTDSSGTQSNNPSGGPAISADGRHVVFQSSASNLVANDTNGMWDIFIKDTQTDVTTRVNTDTDGNQSDGFTGGYTVSGDGRYVAFESDGDDLVENDTNFDYDSFVKDLQTGTTMRVSTDSDGNQVSWGESPFISADGAYVAFESSDPNLVAGDTNGATDVFVKTMLADEPEEPGEEEPGGGSGGGGDGSSSSGDSPVGAPDTGLPASNMLTSAVLIIGGLGVAAITQRNKLLSLVYLGKK